MAETGNRGRAVSTDVTDDTDPEKVERLLACARIAASALQAGGRGSWICEICGFLSST
jgi:hypothetical protein